ncbi:hypothetical protein PLESTB_001339500 [Pleodorina starrii]|uniref:Uncharacterized protein n=1 Tax=Pleodorina starrii TaxID=330485 RepID=A0A9W6BUU8_9CHLO|nr:hypothetical protein PLESTM_001459200 [Pleodorina starrii]GLC58265.1 hypothetical protein PLESTB_001339500 [Pleodorina starrii]GLC66387.1 hypothetical protein PLESTF_000421900 [Pleodorina starrii]
MVGMVGVRVLTVPRRPFMGQGFCPRLQQQPSATSPAVAPDDIASQKGNTTRTRTRQQLIKQDTPGVPAIAAIIPRVRQQPSPPANQPASSDDTFAVRIRYDTPVRNTARYAL